MRDESLSVAFYTCQEHSLQSVNSHEPSEESKKEAAEANHEDFDSVQSEESTPRFCAIEEQKHESASESEDRGELPQDYLQQEEIDPDESSDDEVVIQFDEINERAAEQPKDDNAGSESDFSEYSFDVDDF